MSRFTKLLGARLLGRRSRWEEAWSVFPGDVEGAPALWTVDMGAIEAAPVAALPVRLDVSATYPVGDPTGMPDADALSRIYALEEAVAAAATQLGGAFIGRVTSAGVCRFTAHLPEAPPAPPRFPGGATVLTEFDPHWAYVRDKLAPDARQAHIMGDLVVVQALEQHGNLPDVPRPVEFFAYFPAQEPAEAAAAELRARGHEATVERDDEGDYALRSVLTTGVAPPALHDLTWAVRESVERNGGTYDGWGCPIAT